MKNESEKIMLANSVPNPTALKTIPGLFDVRRDWCFKNIECCTPGIVMDYSREQNIALVKPLVRKVLDNGESADRATIPLTVLRMQHGSFLMDAPLHVGDTGWIIAGDRDTSTAIEANAKIQDKNSGIGKYNENGEPISNSGSQTPPIFTSHKYQFGFFMPDKWGGIKLPEAMKESFVIQHIAPDSSSHGRFVMDRDGSIHLMSTRWKESGGSIPIMRGGLVEVDLRYKVKDERTKIEGEALGDINAIAMMALTGSLSIRKYGESEGNLSVEGDTTLVGRLFVGMKALFRGVTEFLGSALFKKEVVVQEDGKSVEINPKRDLYKSDAKFREIMMVTGIDKRKTKNGKVTLKVQKVRALVDEPENGEAVEFKVGTSGGGDVPVINIDIIKDITDFNFRDGKIKFTVVKANVDILAEHSIDRLPKEVAVYDANNLTEVVINTKYEDTNFYQKKVKAYIPFVGDEQEDDLVFETTPLSEETDSGSSSS